MESPPPNLRQRLTPLDSLSDKTAEQMLGGFVIKGVQG
jgi:hypothetical protein